MIDERAGADARWYLIHTQPRQEDRAVRNLRSQGLETLAPVLKERRYNQHTGELTAVVKHLFPQYVFARFDVNGSLQAVRRTKGVHCLVSSYDCPIPIDDSIIRAIRSQTGEDGFIRIGEDSLPEEGAVTDDDPLKAFMSIFARQMDDADRLAALLTMIGYQGRMS
jgi:transcriptional antiterminator RfaH